MQQPPSGWQQQPPPGYGQAHGQHPQYRHGPPQPPPGPPPKKRRRAPWIVLGILFGVLLLLAGYLFLTYSRSVGAPPSAEPIPPQCELSAGLLAQIGATSWQSGPLRDSGKVKGVSCRWVAAEDENVDERMLTVSVLVFPSAKAAKKQVATRAKELGADEKVDVADQMLLDAGEGDSFGIARKGKTVFDFQLAGSAKSFFSGILGDSVETEIPAAQAREWAIAVVTELAAKAK